jgi:hypothetical protein
MLLRVRTNNLNFDGNGTGSIRNSDPSITREL